MAPNTKSEPKSENQSSWDEARLKESMDHLDQLHLKLRDLRTTIPRMLSPLTDKQPSPEALFHSFSGSVVTAHKEVQEFTEMQNDDKTRQVLEYAARRRREEPKGIKPGSGTDNTEWTSRKEA